MVGLWQPGFTAWHFLILKHPKTDEHLERSSPITPLVLELSHHVGNPISIGNTNQMYKQHSTWMDPSTCGCLDEDPTWGYACGILLGPFSDTPIYWINALKHGIRWEIFRWTMVSVSHDFSHGLAIFLGKSSIFASLMYTAMLWSWSTNTPRASGLASWWCKIEWTLR